MTQVLSLLGGARVVECGGGIALSFCGRLLADLGADVVKVEPAAGCELRRASPGRSGAPPGEPGLLFGFLNHGKRSVTLDVDGVAGSRVFARLAAEAALVLVDERTAPILAGEFPTGGASGSPAIIAITPHGLGKDRPAWPLSELTLQHASGFAYHQASPVSDPETTPPVAGADHEALVGAGLGAAVAALWALLGSAPAAGPRWVDFSLVEFLAQTLIETFVEWDERSAPLNRQRKPGQAIVIAGGLVWLLPCSDGAVMISPREDHQWQRWTAVLGSPDWTRDEALCGSRDLRVMNAEPLRKLMSLWTEPRTRDEVVVAAQTAQIACFPVSRAADLVRNEQLRHRDFFDVLGTGRDGVLIPGLPFRLGSGGLELERHRSVHAPLLGGGNAVILGEDLGLTDAEIAGARGESIA